MNLWLLQVTGECAPDEGRRGFTNRDFHSLSRTLIFQPAHIHHFVMLLKPDPDMVHEPLQYNLM